MARGGLNPPALFRVTGMPAPQGSKVAFARNGRVVLLEGKQKGRAALQEWRGRVAVAGRAWREAQGLDLYDGPLSVVLTFSLLRPGTVTRRHPAVRPDIDKLSRAVLDGLTGSLLVDDSRVVDLRATKSYATTEDDCGVVISVEQLP